MRPTTLCFPVQGNPIARILLGKKKTGFGQGKYNGFGGKIEQGEGVRAAAVRELYEESGLIAEGNHLWLAGCLDFIFPVQRELNHSVDIFLVDTWQGEPKETAEMQPVWFAPSEIPYTNMWVDDIHWLPKVLDGFSVKGQVVFAADNENITKIDIICSERYRGGNFGKNG